MREPRINCALGWDEKVDEMWLSQSGSGEQSASVKATVSPLAYFKP